MTVCGQCVELLCPVVVATSSSLIGLYYRVCHTASLRSTLQGGRQRVQRVHVPICCTVHLCTGCSRLCIHRILRDKLLVILLFRQGVHEASRLSACLEMG